MIEIHTAGTNINTKLEWFAKCHKPERIRGNYSVEARPIDGNNVRITIPVSYVVSNAEFAELIALN